MRVFALCFLILTSCGIDKFRTVGHVNGDRIKLVQVLDHHKISYKKWNTLPLIDKRILFEVYINQVLLDQMVRVTHVEKSQILEFFDKINPTEVQEFEREFYRGELKSKLSDSDIRKVRRIRAEELFRKRIKARSAITIIQS